MSLLGNIGEGCNANTEIIAALTSSNIVTHRRRNCSAECNSPTSARHLDQVKMYADLARNKKRKKLEIKSFNGNNVDKFELVSDTIPTALTVYVTKVNAADSYLVLQTNPVDASAPVPAVMAPYVLADNPKLLPCGYTAQKECDMSFCSIDENLGYDGSAQHFGVDRDSSPLLRGDYYDLSESTAATIIKDFMQVFYRRAEECSQETMEVLVPYALFAVFSKELEHSKERSNSDKNALIGYSSVTFCLPEGRVKITAVPKLPSDCAYILDWNSWAWLGDSDPRDPEAPGTQPSWYRERGCGRKMAA